MASPEPLKQDARGLLSADFDLLEIEALDQTQGLALVATLEKIAQSTVDYNAKNLKALLGIDVRATSGIGPAIDMFRDRNVALIKSLVGNQIRDLRGFLESAETSGMRVEDLRKTIEDRFQVSRSKADLLARDQILKLNGAITKERQTRAGVDSYVWTTSGDERVREEHAALEGQVFSWLSPPPPGHPGEDYQCRCTAFPIIPELDS